MPDATSIRLQRVGDHVLVEFTIPDKEQPLSLLLQVDVAAKLGTNLIMMSSSLARDSLDDADEELQ